MHEDNAHACRRRGARLERLRQERDGSLKDLVNEALRLGLREMTATTATEIILDANGKLAKHI